MQHTHNVSPRPECMTNMASLVALQTFLLYIYVLHMFFYTVDHRYIVERVIVYIPQIKIVVPISRRFSNESHFPGSNSGVAAAVIAGAQNMFVQGIGVNTFPAKFISSSAQIANTSFHHHSIYEISTWQLDSYTNKPWRVRTVQTDTAPSNIVLISHYEWNSPVSTPTDVAYPFYRFVIDR